MGPAPPAAEGMPVDARLLGCFRRANRALGHAALLPLILLSACTDDVVPPGPARQCTGAWQTVASDPFGWLDPPQGREQSSHRFTKAPAPDGSMAIQHTIKTTDVVWPLGHNSPIFRPEPGYVAVLLRHRMWIEEGVRWNEGHKHMSLMGGRGQAGGAYADRQETGPEGWSHYMGTNPRNKVKMWVGAANRSDMGAKCVETVRPGGDPINDNNQRCYEITYGYEDTPPDGRWVTIELVSVMNEKGLANGEAYFTIDGIEGPHQPGIMWAMDPEASPELWVRWRMMYGGNPEELRPPNDMITWYKDFEIAVCY